MQATPSTNQTPRAIDFSQFFQVHLTKNQAEALQMLLPLRYSLQLQPKRRGNLKASADSTSKSYSNLPKNRQLKSLLQQASNQGYSDYKNIDEYSSANDSLRPTQVNIKPASSTKVTITTPAQNKERQFYGDLMLCFLDSVRQQSEIVKFYKEQIKKIQQKVTSSLEYPLVAFEEDFNQIFKLHQRPRSNRKLSIQTLIQQLYSKWKDNIKLELQTARHSQHQTETNHETKERVCQIQQKNQANKEKKISTNSKQRGRPKNLTKKMGKTTKQLQAKLQRQKSSLKNMNLNQKTAQAQKIPFPQACKIMRRLKLLTKEQHEQVLDDAKMSSIDTLTIRQSTRSDLRVFLDSLNRILQSQYQLSLSDEESHSHSEEYIESSFEVEDEV